MAQLLELGELAHGHGVAQVQVTGGRVEAAVGAAGGRRRDSASCTPAPAPCCAWSHHRTRHRHQRRELFFYRSKRAHLLYSVICLWYNRTRVASSRRNKKRGKRHASHIRSSKHDQAAACTHRRRRASSAAAHCPRQTRPADTSRVRLEVGTAGTHAITWLDHSTTGRGCQSHQGTGAFPGGERASMREWRCGAEPDTRISAQRRFAYSWRGFVYPR